MRRIVSKRTEAKSRKKKQLIVGLVLIFLMFFSTLGYAFQLIGNNRGIEEGNDLNAPTQIVNYNGFEFESRGIFWTLNKDGTNFIFTYNPNEVDRSYEEVNPLENYIDKPLYIDSENTEAKSELRANLLKFVSNMEDACLSDEEICDEETKRITCNENFIKIREVSNNALEGITQENNCVFINAKKENLIKMTDEFLFKILGIES